MRYPILLEEKIEHIESLETEMNTKLKEFKNETHLMVLGILELAKEIVIPNADKNFHVCYSAEGNSDGSIGKVLRLFRSPADRKVLVEMVDGNIIDFTSIYEQDLNYVCDRIFDVIEK